MEDTYVKTNRPTRSRAYNWAWILMLPLFFFLGWVTNDAITQSQSYQAEPGVGGAPFVEEQGDSPSPTTKPQPTVSDDEVDALPEISPSPTDTPLIDDSNDENREMMN